MNLHETAGIQQSMIKGAEEIHNKSIIISKGDSNVGTSIVKYHA